MELPWILLVVCISFAYASALKPGECEVCNKTLHKFVENVDKEEMKLAHRIEKKFKHFCENSRKKIKENRFCYYLGGLKESATGILNHVTEPLSNGIPIEKVCEKLKKVDSQICELRYDVEIDLKTVDLKKLKVRDLKKIINDWGEDCQGCIEKVEYIQRIEELKPIHTEL